MLLRICVAVVMVALLGCGHTHEVLLPSRQGDTTLEQVDRRTRGRTAQITLRDGRVYQAQGTRVWPDSTVFRAGDSGAEVAVATSDVRRISFKDRRRGALEGLMVGALIGFPAGVLIMDSPGGTYDAEDRIKSAFSGGVAGVFWGAAIGALAGGRITYVFIPPRAGQSTTDPVVVPSAKRR